MVLAIILFLAPSLPLAVVVEQEPQTVLRAALVAALVALAELQRAALETRQALRQVKAITAATRLIVVACITKVAAAVLEGLGSMETRFPVHLVTAAQDQPRLFLAPA